MTGPSPLAAEYQRTMALVTAFGAGDSDTVLAMLADGDLGTLVLALLQTVWVAMTGVSLLIDGQRTPAELWQAFAMSAEMAYGPGSQDPEVPPGA